MKHKLKEFEKLQPIVIQNKEILNIMVLSNEHNIDLIINLAKHWPNKPVTYPPQTHIRSNTFKL